MDITEILSIISDVAKDQNSSIFIVGGIPRDKVLKKPENIEDIDLTTGDKKIHYVSKEVSLKIPNSSYKALDDGHSQITMNNLKLDFSSNFNVPNVKSMLSKAGIKNPTDMQAELYSRDFTCNALLMTLDLKTITDPTGLGLKDIKSKTLRTCLPAAITLGYDNKRIVRIIYLACKLGFDIDQEIIDWVKRHQKEISIPTQKYTTNKLIKAIEYDKGKTVDLLDKMGLWKYIPPLKELNLDIIKNPERI